MISSAEVPVTVQITGEDIRPGVLTLDDLIGYLRPLQEAIAATLQEEGEDTEGPVLTLTGIEPGSARVLMGMSPASATALARVATAVNLGRYDLLTPTALAAVARLVGRTVERGHEYRITAAPAYGIPDTTISPATAETLHLPPAATVKGPTTIYGRCITVGGTQKPRATVHLHTGGYVLVYGNEEQIRALGRLLYEDIAAEGIATWLMPDWELTSLQLAQVAPHPYTSPLQAFAKLQALDGAAWREVDAEAYVDALRHGTAPT